MPKLLDYFTECESTQECDGIKNHENVNAFDGFWDEFGSTIHANRN